MRRKGISLLFERPEQIRELRIRQRAAEPFDVEPRLPALEKGSAEGGEHKTRVPFEWKFISIGRGRIRFPRGFPAKIVRSSSANESGMKRRDIIHWVSDSAGG